VQVVVLRGVLGPPDLLEQHAVGQNLVGVRGEGLQQAVLGRREVDLASGDRDAATLEIDFQVAGAKYRVRTGRRARRVPQSDANAGEKLIDPEGLGQVVVSTNVERNHLVPLGRPRRKNHDRRARVAANVTDGVHAVRVGQPQVEQDDVRPVGQERACLLPRFRALNLEPMGREVGADHAKDGGLVIDDENASARLPAHDATVSRDEGVASSIEPGLDRGSVKATTLPRAGRASTQIRPPCASTRPLATASPRPVPLPWGRESPR
jgi:hypothetical protein